MTSPVPFGEDGENVEADLDFEEKGVRFVILSLVLKTLGRLTWGLGCFTHTLLRVVASSRLPRRQSSKHGSRQKGKRREVRTNCCRVGILRLQNSRTSLDD